MYSESQVLCIECYEYLNTCQTVKGNMSYKPDFVMDKLPFTRIKASFSLGATDILGGLSHISLPIRAATGLRRWTIIEANQVRGKSGLNSVLRPNESLTDMRLKLLSCFSESPLHVDNLSH